MSVGGVLIFLRRERLGCGLGYLGLLVSLTMVNLLLFYFNQFAAVTTSIWVFALLVVLGRYRRTYLGIGSPITVLSNLARKTPATISGGEGG
jgi:hypothetical protein